MKRVIVFLTFALMLFIGQNEIYSKSRNSRSAIKKTQTKKQMAQSNSSVKFSIETILDKNGGPIPSLGQSLERAGFTKNFQKQSNYPYDYGSVATIEKQYVKNGIKVFYSYEKSNKAIIYINISFPNKSSQNEFVKTIRPFANKNRLEMDDYGTNIIEYPSDYGYGQISIEGLRIDFIWI